MSFVTSYPVVGSASPTLASLNRTSFTTSHVATTPPPFSYAAASPQYPVVASPQYPVVTSPLCTGAPQYPVVGSSQCVGTGLDTFLTSGVAEYGAGYSMLESAAAPVYCSQYQQIMQEVPVVTETAVVEAVAPVVHQTYQQVTVEVPVPVRETIVEPPPAVVMGAQKYVTMQRKEVKQTPPQIIVQAEPHPPHPPATFEFHTNTHVIENGPKANQLQNQIQNVKERLDISIRVESELRQQLQETNRRIKQSVDRQGELASKEFELQRLRDEVFAMDMRIVQADGLHSVTEQNIANLESKLRIAEQRSAMLPRTEAEIENSKIMLQEAHGRLVQCENDWNMAQRTISSLEAQITQMNDNLRKDRAAFESERSTLHQQLSELKRMVANVENQRGEAMRQVEFFGNKLRESEAHAKSVETKIAQFQASMEGERNQLHAQLSEVQQKLAMTEAQRDEMRREIAFWENKAKEAEDRLRALEAQIRELLAKIASLETEIANLKARLQAKMEVHSQTHVKETYKVKTFEMAAKLAVMDGTDDGMYNGLPIEVEGQGLYRDLVARGRRPIPDAPGRPTSLTGAADTYIVPSLEVAASLSKMNPLDDGTYKGLPIEVKGLGLYRNLRARR